jgi:type I restriction enzyme R subunit
LPGRHVTRHFLLDKPTWLNLVGGVNGCAQVADTALAMSKAFTLCCTLVEAKAVREEVAFMQGVKVCTPRVRDRDSEVH